MTTWQFLIYNHCLYQFITLLYYGMCTAAVKTIQEAVCQQRYNYQLWMALSRVCVSLSNTLKSPQGCESTRAGGGHNEMYTKESSVEIVKKAVPVMKPHFKLRHVNKEEISSNTVSSIDSTTAMGGGEDKLWIIDALGKAVTDDGDQLHAIKLADSEVFPYFLIILCCGSCLWARYASG